MVEDFLAKISAKTFFTVLGILVGLVILTVISIVTILIVTNFNVLQWIE